MSLYSTNHLNMMQMTQPFAGCTWSNLTFSELMKFDPKKAFEYRFMALGDPIPEEYADKPAKPTKKTEQKDN